MNLNHKRKCIYHNIFHSMHKDLTNINSFSLSCSPSFGSSNNLLKIYLSLFNNYKSFLFQWLSIMAFIHKTKNTPTSCTLAVSFTICFIPLFQNKTIGKPSKKNKGNSLFWRGEEIIEGLG